MSNLSHYLYYTYSTDAYYIGMVYLGNRVRYDVKAFRCELEDIVECTWVAEECRLPAVSINDVNAMPVLSWSLTVAT